jgi:hypothetical protein
VTAWQREAREAGKLSRDIHQEDDSSSSLHLHARHRTKVLQDLASRCEPA